MWIIPLVIIFLLAGVILFINQPQFGKIPDGKRLDRIRKSPNYRDGKFQNQNITPQITSKNGFAGAMIEFLFNKKERNIPTSEIPSIKVDLHKINRNEDILVWFGHSSCYIQLNGKRFLIDPVFSETASPIPFTNKAFKGTNQYQAEDIPAIDYLIITHDHWDHLDYPTIKTLKPKIGKVICPLGVGEHFEYWKFDVLSLMEMDWHEEIIIDNGLEIYCLPARHFSGRGLSANQSLWASFLIKTPDYKMYISGDGGYDSHFTDVARRFGNIDLVLLEDGQYNANWKYIHLMPEDMQKTIANLHAKKVLPVHHSKFALSNHAWDEPLANITEGTGKTGYTVLTPLIGEPVYLRNDTQEFQKWWQEIKE